MRAVLQRVLRARVQVEGATVGEIGRGLLVFLGVRVGDTGSEAESLATKIHGLRLFDDDEGRMNLPIDAVDGAYLVVSQFTLYGDLSKGKRPGFEAALKPPEAERLYREFCGHLARLSGRAVRTGRFGAMMQVELVNDGPATFLLSTDPKSEA
jgi:D-tyrosyl-tRNA(Tyr) deacylase